MDELISQLATAARGMWKHRWLGLLVAWVGTAVGMFVVLSVPDKYEATARIYVDTQSILKPLMSGLAVQPNVDQQVVMLSRTLISRPNIEKLIRMADLDLKVQSKSAKEGLIDGLMQTLEIKNVGRDNLYVLSYRDSSPDKAKRVVQSLVSIFIESSLGDSRKDSTTARKFIDDQIQSYVTKLEEAETRLKQFKLRNLELQNAEGRDMAGQIGVVSAQLSQARLELREAENARDSAKRQLDAERDQNANITSRSLLQESAMQISTPEIDARIDAQKRQLDGLLQRFTEQHPDVVGTRRLIQELESAKRKELAELRKTALANPASASANSLVYQELNRLLATSEVQVAGLRARVGEYEARFARARELMKTAPQIEAELAQLNRDYDINKKNYNDLVTRRESAAMSGDLDSATGMADFRLIDPPRASPQPVAPNRLLMMPFVLLAALGAGLAVAFAASQLRAVFYDARSLKETLGLPLLGVVTLVMDDASVLKKKLELKKFWAASGGLVGVFITGMVMFSVMSGRPG
ncbi:MAG: chain length-determining protein [Gammaproteobacteria bacterium]|uniref:XrtA system polysaccharide chain length determinant n=1 Tax=Rhodoferax sp. TaxID=50421 RepID=UPI001799413E|nr:XrtA system polysaccharide chain length determinant [Rhodoferax sp.]MBU3897476.1 chain length-determining protein [Gammaproteobacteria bacterium]MBA3058907.1 chain length-determining protein [Rhodoferax sp.]MBU3996212.1 chain length-determining protein [Gammaproteobacteria bacterium]MBU4018822.1 chain length-determining protein [Gammaproteobacteria bacterium]MBU4079777.1 chain length-determining protein [Gammaproteobacteria bacterium]